jgi:hypothetical protein
MPLPILDNDTQGSEQAIHKEQDGFTSTPQYFAYLANI